MDLFEIQESNILFIKNVYISNCVDVSKLDEMMDFGSSSSEEFDELDDDAREIEDGDLIYKLKAKIIENERFNDLISSTCRKEDILSIYSTSMIIPEKIPRYFYNLEDWPKYTRIKCWSCDRNFNDVPWFVPLGYNKILLEDTNRVEKIAMVVHGNFCSPNCTAWWIRKVRDPRIGNSRSDIDEKLRLLQELYQKIHGEPISFIQESPWKTEMQQYGGDITSSKFSEKIEEIKRIKTRDFVNTLASMT